MHAIARRCLLAVAGVAAVSVRANAQPADEPIKVMDRYAAALATGNVEALVALYADNGIFMRPETPEAVGRDALRQMYKEVVATLKLTLKFTVHEVEMQGDMAWLRSSSVGRVKVLATGVESDDSYNELVVFRRTAGTWKIRSYMYVPRSPTTSAKT